ncbi:MAG: hypothetical protein EOP49_43990, partial [Sphingobacteriales bacterium]
MTTVAPAAVFAQPSQPIPAESRYWTSTEAKNKGVKMLDSTTWDKKMKLNLLKPETAKPALTRVLREFTRYSRYGRVDPTTYSLFHLANTGYFTNIALESQSSLMEEYLNKPSVQLLIANNKIDPLLRDLARRFGFDDLKCQEYL